MADYSKDIEYNQQEITNLVNEKKALEEERKRLEQERDLYIVSFSRFLPKRQAQIQKNTLKIEKINERCELITHLKNVRRSIALFLLGNALTDAEVEEVNLYTYYFNNPADRHYVALINIDYHKRKAQEEADKNAKPKGFVKTMKQNMLQKQ